MCNIAYDHGIEENQVPEVFIRSHQELNKFVELERSNLPQDNDLFFSAGTNVMVKSKYQQWYPAVVLKVQCSSTRQKYFIEFVTRKGHDKCADSMNGTVADREWVNVDADREWVNMEDVRRRFVFENVVELGGNH